MAKKLYDEYDISEIASAIRKKNGKEDKYKVNEMAQAIGEISTGIEPTGTKDITSNGTYDVTNYASANVNVSGGVDLSNYFLSTNPSSSYLSAYTRLMKKAFKIPNLTIASSTLYGFFYNCLALEDISELSSLQTNLSTQIAFTFYGCGKLKNLSPLSSWNTTNVTNMASCFTFLGNNNTTTMYNFEGIKNWNTAKVTNFANCFDNIYNSNSSWLNTVPENIELNWCLDRATSLNYFMRGSATSNNLLKNKISGFYTKSPTTSNLTLQDTFNNQRLVKYIDLSKVVRKVSSLSQTFYNCSSLEIIDIRGLTCSSITSAGYISGTLNNVPTTVSIIVKDTTEKNWWVTKFSNYADCIYTVDEAIEKKIVDE